jgi:hypothetical protein
MPDLTSFLRQDFSDNTPYEETTRRMTELAQASRGEAKAPPPAIPAGQRPAMTAPGRPTAAPGHAAQQAPRPGPRLAGLRSGAAAPASAPPAAQGKSPQP